MKTIKLKIDPVFILILIIYKKIPFLIKKSYFENFIFRLLNVYQNNNKTRSEIIRKNNKYSNWKKCSDLYIRNCKVFTRGYSIDKIINCNNNVAYTRVKRLNNNIITIIFRKHFKTNNENLEYNNYKSKIKIRERNNDDKIIIEIYNFKFR